MTFDIRGSRLISSYPSYPRTNNRRDGPATVMGDDEEQAQSSSADALTVDLDDLLRMPETPVVSTP